MLRSTTLSAFWLGLAAFGAWLGLGPAIQVRFGEAAVPTAIAFVASIIVVVWLVVPQVRARILGWSRLMALSGLFAVTGAWAAEFLADSFECQGSCFGVLNSALGYACGEWSSGCITEWFLILLVVFGVALGSFPRFRPNHRFVSDAKSALRPDNRAPQPRR